MGYTEGIKDGITFENFLWACARAFGPLAIMRDEPPNTEIPVEFKPSDFYATRLKEERAKYKKLKSMTSKVAEKEAEKHYKKGLSNELKYKDDALELKEKYLSMLSKVNQWEPPSIDHIELKNFMIEQINQSIQFDCDNLNKSDLPIRLSGHEWLKMKIEESIRLVAYLSEQKHKEEDRIAKINLWIKQLRNSLS
jgi:hypothetical protein